MRAIEIQKRLAEISDAADARFLQGFFKTGPGEYGEGDQFRGIRVPPLRLLAREFQSLDTMETLTLLRSPWHEDRLLALMIFVRQYAKGDEAVQSAIYALYLAQVKYINNWDLIDGSAMYIVGAYLEKRERKVLETLARSTDLWERRIAIMSTFWFVRRGEFAETLKIAALLVGDEHDLIHKATGWMLREVGKRDLQAEEDFLQQHYRKMPRTMLRYAIEKFPEVKRQGYLKGTV